MDTKEMIEQTSRSVVKPKKVTMKQTFGETASKTTYSREELMKMKVGDVRKLIREHNLHNVIKGYSKMKKSALVTAFLAKQAKPAKTKKKKVEEVPAPSRKSTRKKIVPERLIKTM
jgi:queuine/archaeosine tRNA-ribosyltransferase